MKIQLIHFYYFWTQVNFYVGCISDKPKPTQTWKPKSSLQQNDTAARASSPSSTCEQDKIGKEPNEKAMQASVKDKVSSSTPHPIATAYTP